jgi:U3 small nucleolar RNA-associated protein 18
LLCREGPPPGRLDVTRVRDANAVERAAGVVRALAFHPTSALLLVGSADKRLSFFQADGVKSAHLQTVFLEDLPVRSAAFVGDSTVIVSGRRRFFYVLDLPTRRLERIKNVQGCADRSLETFAVPPAASSSGSGVGQTSCIAFLGNEGAVPLVSLATRQRVGELRCSGQVTAAAFDASGTDLVTSGSDGCVHIWDLRTRRCRDRFADEGCLRGAALALSPSRLASGSDVGVVNVYDRGALNRRGEANGHAAPPRPLRAFDNLVTVADTLAFSGDGQLLVMASRMKKDALRVVHVPSLTTYSNWPTGRSPLHYVHCAAFSPQGGLLAVGNAKGHVLTYRLHHYGAI